MIYLTTVKDYLTVRQYRCNVFSTIDKMRQWYTPAKHVPLSAKNVQEAMG